MFKRIAYVALLFIILLTTNGCLFIFSRNKQRIKVTSTTPNATIYYIKDSVGVNQAQVRIDKRYLFQTFVVKADGYYTKNFISGERKYIFMRPLIYCDYFGMLPSLYNRLPRVCHFDNNVIVPEMTKINPRKSDEKHIEVDKISINVKEEDFRVQEHVNYKQYIKFMQNENPAQKNTRTKQHSDTRNNFKVENSVATEELASILKEFNFIDTNEKLFKNELNTLFIDATVNKIVFHRVYFNNPNRNSNFFTYSGMLAIDLDVQWEVKNNYKQSIYSKKTTLRSDPFQFDVDTKMAFSDTIRFKKKKDTVSIYMAIMKAMKNNLAYSFIQLREEMTQKGLLKRTDIKESYDEISIKKTTPTGSGKIGDYLDAAVSVKVDNGHGSGFCISEDGYILTNYHVIANTKKIEVVFNDGSSELATIVRTSLTGDLALLKVNRKDLKTVHVTSLDLPEAGTEVWTIGTPKSIELGQSVTKGIVSSFKKGADLEYIQTDVKISPGNSGGALLTKNGSLMGMISLKIIDEATEGIGFAISTADILKLLKIEIKP